jgi:hypothetical protein
MESNRQPQSTHATFGMSWTAYVRPLAIFLVIGGIGVAFLQSRYELVGAILVLIALALLSYQVLMIRSVRLYTDADGVWVYGGILPWAKGMYGVKWRDLEDASYFQGLVSWVCRSYTVRVGHRFTKASEIVLRHIHRGNLAVEHINEMHKQALAGAPMERLA